MANKFLRNSIFGSVAGISTTFGNFLSGVLVARLLGVTQTGEVAFLIWLVNTTTTVAAAGIPFAISRYLPELLADGQNDAAGRLLATLFRRFMALVTLSVLVYLGYAVWLGWGAPQGPGEVDTLRRPLIFVLVAIMCGGQATADYVRAYYRGFQQFRDLAKITILANGLQIALIAVGSVLFGAAGAIGGYIVGVSLPALMIKKTIASEAVLDPALQKRVSRYARYRWAAEMMAAFVGGRVEVLFLQIWWGSGSVGYFTVGLTLANLAVQGPLMLTWGLLPRFTEQYGKNELDSLRAAYCSATRLMALLVFPACLGLAAVSPTVLPLLFGESFRPSIPVAASLIVSAAIPAVAMVGSNVLWAMDRSDLDFYSGIVGTIVAVICGLTLTRAFGPMGAACSRILAQTAVVGIVGWFTARTLKMAPPFYDLAWIFMAAAGCGASAWLCSWLVPGRAGLPLSIAIGALAYFAGLRFLKAVPSEDAARIRSLATHLPGAAHRPIHYVLKAVIG